MKRLFFLILLVGIMYSCTNEVDRIPATEPQNAGTMPILSLNKDQKWRADEFTTAGIEGMQEIMEHFNASKNTGSVQAYQELGKILNGELNTIFRQCTMTGAAHDELHKFLIPVVEDVKILQGENLEASTAALMRLEERLFMYQTFFE